MMSYVCMRKSVKWKSSRYFQMSSGQHFIGDNIHKSRTRSSLNETDLLVHNRDKGTLQRVE